MSGSQTRLITVNIRNTDEMLSDLAAASSYILTGLKPMTVSTMTSETTWSQRLARTQHSDSQDCPRNIVHTVHGITLIVICKKLNVEIYVHFFNLSSIITFFTSFPSFPSRCFLSSSNAASNFCLFSFCSAWNSFFSLAMVAFCLSIFDLCILISFLSSSCKITKIKAALLPVQCLSASCALARADLARSPAVAVWATGPLVSLGSQSWSVHWDYQYRAVLYSTVHTPHPPHIIHYSACK